MPDPPTGTVPTESGIAVPVSEIQFTYVRSSGPGGQNVNKVATKAQLRWPVSESPSLADDVKRRLLSRYRRRITTDGCLLISSQRTRSQSRNAEDCLEKLGRMLDAVARAPTRRKKTKPSASSKRRRLENKRRRSQTKQMRRPPAGE